MPTWESTLHDWEWIVGVNLMGVVHGVRTFTPILLEQGEGHIVNTASMAGLISGAGNALYGVTKHAVVALSEALFNELRAQDAAVRVSVLCPGFINTEILRSSERNQPDAVRSHRPERRTSPEAEIRRKQVEHMVASGLAPRKVGELVLDAIRERPLLDPHSPRVEERDPPPDGEHPRRARPDAGGTARAASCCARSRSPTAAAAAAAAPRTPGCSARRGSARARRGAAGRRSPGAGR